MSNLERSGAYRRTEAGNIDWYYGGGASAWADKTTALAGVPSAARLGKIVAIWEDDLIVEYIWHTDITDSGLVKRDRTTYPIKAIVVLPNDTKLSLDTDGYVKYTDPVLKGNADYPVFANGYSTFLRNGTAGPNGIEVTFNSAEGSVTFKVFGNTGTLAELMVDEVKLFPTYYVTDPLPPILATQWVIPYDNSVSSTVILDNWNTLYAPIYGMFPKIDILGRNINGTDNNTLWEYSGPNGPSYVLDPADNSKVLTIKFDFFPIEDGASAGYIIIGANPQTNLLPVDLTINNQSNHRNQVVNNITGTTTIIVPANSQMTSFTLIVQSETTTCGIDIKDNVTLQTINILTNDTTFSAPSSGATLYPASIQNIMYFPNATTITFTVANGPVKARTDYIINYF